VQGMIAAARLGVLGGLMLATALPVTAQQPRVVNAKMQTRPAAAVLEKEFRTLLSAQGEPAWIGYAVPVIAGQHQMCCYSSGDEFTSTSGCCGPCRLESSRGINLSTDEHAASLGTVKLEGPDYLVVLFRIEHKRVDRIRAFSEDCQLDAGGLPFTWLTNVQPAESVAWLASFVTAPLSDTESETKPSQASQHALTAIALHADPAADRALEGFVSPNQPESLRGHAAFWLGAARGKQGLAVLKRMAHEDPSDRVREKVTFALSVSHEPEAVEEMIRMARSDSSSRVRGQALFWLGQKAGKKAASAITAAIENDPETEVKKRAVFALSQLPKDEGVPLLIQVARTNRNPTVRKQAMFWLGQSNDPRALAFFEEILLR
jgi:hypothetical protein